jgi:hypothetical protein
MANAALRAKVQRTYTKVARKFFGEGATIEFLDLNEFQDGYDVLWSWSSGWWIDYDNYNRNFVLEGVDDDIEFAETVIPRATYLRLTANTAATPVIYKIDRRKIEPPQGAEVSWTIRCDRVMKAVGNFTGLGR